MNYRENAATVKTLDCPPRQDSRRCGIHHNAAPSFNQYISSGPQNHKPQGDKKMQELALKQEDFSVIEQVVMQGDLSKLNPEQRVTYYKKVCESSGLNPFTNPFAYILLNGKLTLYAKKDCTEQLRKINGVSIEGLEDRIVDDLYIVTARARDKTGRMDQSTGAVVIGHLKGEAKANAIMKAETKAKRRVTLSICGMGWTDESEIDSIPNAKPIDVDFNTGEIKGSATIVKPEENKPKLTKDQIDEIEMILEECEDSYRDFVYSSVKRLFKSDDLTGVPADMYDRMKSAAVKNMEQTHEKQKQEQADLIAAEVQ